LFIYMLLTQSGCCCEGDFMLHDILIHRSYLSCRAIGELCRVNENAYRRKHLFRRQCTTLSRVLDQRLSSFITPFFLTIHSTKILSISFTNPVSIVIILFLPHTHSSMPEFISDFEKHMKGDIK